MDVLLPGPHATNTCAGGCFIAYTAWDTESPASSISWSMLKPPDGDMSSASNSLACFGPRVLSGMVLVAVLSGRMAWEVRLGGLFAFAVVRKRGR